jgi:mRNA interferase MazF
MPYSDFKKSKARPVLVFKLLEKDDILVLPLTTNLTRKGLILTNNDIVNGSLKKDSVVIIPKLTAIDSSLISKNNIIATITKEKMKQIKQMLCLEFQC